MTARSEAADAPLDTAHPATRTAAGIGLTILAIGLFTVMDAIGKVLMARYPVPQVVWARYFFQLSWMLLLIPGSGDRPGAHHATRYEHRARPSARGLDDFHVCVDQLRSACRRLYHHLHRTAPGHGILDPVARRAGRLAALERGVRGFVGVLIVIRPGFGMAHWALALPLVPAVGFALYQILTRKVSGTPGETAFAMLFHLAWVGTAMLTAVVPFFWQTIAPLDWLPMAAMGALGGLGHLILIRALTIAPASLLAPFAYTQIAWALLLGYLVFGDVPDVDAPGRRGDRGKRALRVLSRGGAGPLLRGEGAAIACARAGSGRPRSLVSTRSISVNRPVAGAAVRSCCCRGPRRSPRRSAQGTPGSAPCPAPSAGR